MIEFSKLATAAGGVTKIANQLGISYQAVQQWGKKGVPANRVLKLEELSGVSRTKIRPDLYPSEVE